MDRIAEKDVLGIKYFEDKEHFADLLNGLFFDGEPYILPEYVKEQNRSTVLRYTKDDKKKSNVIYRDVIKEVDVCMKTAIITLEHQTDIHYAMPVRVMSGDSALYQEQWKDISKKHRAGEDLSGAEYVSGFSNEEKLKPVATIIVYFGKKPWDGPHSLKEMLDLEGLPEKMKEYIVDYPIHIFEIRNDTNYENFKTDLRLICGFLRRDHNKEELRAYVQKNAQEFEKLAEDTYELISVYSGSKKMLQFLENNKNETGGINMCKAIDDMIADGIKLGEQRGEKRGEKRGMEYGIQKCIELCQEFQLSVDVTLSKIIENFSLTENAAKEYVAKYWI